MIECTKYRSCERGCLLGFADFFVEKWGLEIKDCQLYQKDNRRWINFPSKEFVNGDGEKVFYQIIKFREKEHANAFAEEAKKAIEMYSKNNTVEEKKDIFDDVPF